MSEMSGVRADFNICGTEFLLRELELAQTFMDMASIACNPAHAERAHAHAMTARKIVLRFLASVRPGIPHRQTIERNCARLEARMIAAGLDPVIAKS